LRGVGKGKRGTEGVAVGAGKPPARQIPRGQPRGVGRGKRGTEGAAAAADKPPARKRPRGRPPHEDATGTFQQPIWQRLRDAFKANMYMCRHTTGPTRKGKVVLPITATDSFGNTCHSDEPSSLCFNNPC
jgi:hypothetical protein